MHFSRFALHATCDPLLLHRQAAAQGELKLALRETCGCSGMPGWRPGSGSPASAQRILRLEFGPTRCLVACVSSVWGSAGRSSVHRAPVVRSTVQGRRGTRMGTTPAQHTPREGACQVQGCAPYSVNPFPAPGISHFQRNSFSSSPAPPGARLRPRKCSRETPGGSRRRSQ